MPGHLFNTEKYSDFVLITFCAGCYLWAIVYIIVLRDVIKKKNADVPIMAVAGNFAWEFYWGLGIFMKTDMGSVLQWAYFIWFFLDCFIVYSTFKYGWKQDVVPSEKKDHIFVTALCILLWGAILYFFIPQYDDHIGAYTGWIVNVNISMAFVLQKVKQPGFGTNRWVAVLKFLGTGLCTTVVFINLYQNTTLVALCFIFAVLDIIYIYMVFTGPKYMAAVKAVSS